MKFTTNPVFRLIIVCGLLISVALIIQSYYGESKSIPAITSTEPQQLEPKTSSVPEFIVSASSTIEPDTADYQYCTTFTKKQKRQADTWFRDHYRGWGIYLEQGHSLDDITLAIDHFGNPNFAVGFRVEHLRKDSHLAARDNSVKDKILALMPDFFKQTGIRVSMKVPAPHLADYPSLSENERRRIINEESISIDDVASFIHDKEVPDTIIMELLTAIEEPNASVGYDKLETTSLLDYAVYASRIKVVKELLKKGSTPTTTPYLPSTLEWALAALDYSLNTPANEQAAEIVRMLQYANASAKLQVKNDTEITGFLPGKYYQFKSKEIEFLLQQYGLDLTTLEQHAPLKVDTNNPLIKALEKQRKGYLSDKLGVKDIGKQSLLCKNTIAAINKKWKPERVGVILHRIISQHQDISTTESLYTQSIHPHSVQTQIIAALAKIDPMLIDRYLSSYDGYHRPIKTIPDSNKLFEPLKEDDLAQVLDSFLALPLTEANKNWLFMQILVRDPAFYSELVNADLLTNELQYFHYESYRLLSAHSLKALNNEGVDLFNEDIRGKTLLYYAVKGGNIELIQFMQQEHYPFIRQALGEDPLHIALNTTNHKFEAEKVEDIVNTLMLYTPEIDAFHLSRMALLKLKYPDIYTRITERHPQLKAGPDTPLPRTR